MTSMQNATHLPQVNNEENTSIAVGLAIFFGAVLFIILVLILIFLSIRKRNTGNCATWNCIKIMLSGDRFAAVEAGDGTASLKLPAKRVIKSSLWDVIRCKPARGSPEPKSDAAENVRGNTIYDYCVPEEGDSLLPDDDEGYMQPSAVTGDVNIGNADADGNVKNLKRTSLLRSKWANRGRQAADPLPSLPASSSRKPGDPKKEKPPIKRKPSRLRRTKKSNGNNNVGRDQSVKDTYLVHRYNFMTPQAKSSPNNKFTGSSPTKFKVAMSPPQYDCRKESTSSLEAHYETYDPSAQS